MPPCVEVPRSALDSPEPPQAKKAQQAPKMTEVLKSESALIIVSIRQGVLSPLGRPPQSDREGVLDPLRPAYEERLEWIPAVAVKQSFAFLRIFP